MPEVNPYRLPSIIGAGLGGLGSGSGGRSPETPEAQSFAEFALPIAQFLTGPLTFLPQQLFRAEVQTHHRDDPVLSFFADPFGLQPPPARPMPIPRGPIPGVPSGGPQPSPGQASIGPQGMFGGRGPGTVGVRGGGFGGRGGPAPPSRGGMPPGGIR